MSSSKESLQRHLECQPVHRSTFFHAACKPVRDMRYGCALYRSSAVATLRPSSLRKLWVAAACLCTGARRARTARL